MRIPSYRPVRWFVPPPQRTAYFSSARRPGVVLRVSRMRVGVPSVSSAKRRVSEAIPHRRPTRLSATRSPVSTARAGPSTTASTAGTSETAAPSSSLCSSATVGSSAWKTAAATGTPQTTPGSSRSSSAWQRASAGTSASVVASPAPTSSPIASVTTRSMSAWLSSMSRAPARGRGGRRNALQTRRFRRGSRRGSGRRGFPRARAHSRRRGGRAGVPS